MLIKGMTAEEIRVLQEYRRVQTEAMAMDTIKAIKHPHGGGEAPALSLIAKGYLSATGDAFSLTEKAKEFLAYDPKPEFEASGDATEEAAE